MIIRVDENENETVVYRVRIYCWVFVWFLFYSTKILELTGLPFVYRMITGKNRQTLMQWLVRFQKIWCKKEIYPAGLKIRSRPVRVSIGYIRWLRGF